jgi:uncharacterized protein
MTEDLIPILALLFCVVGALYASVGHAGASGYLAVMALVGVDALVMRPTALVLNILVATIAFVQFARAGHFSWRLFWPFAIASIPAAFLGGRIDLPSTELKLVIGAVLLFTAARMTWSMLCAPSAPAPLRRPRLPVAVLCGGAIGLLAGLTGTGGGIFLSPLLLMLYWADTKQTAAIAALFILLNSLAGMGGLVSAGWTPAPGLSVLAAAACAGGFIGSRFGSARLETRSLKLLLSAVLVIAGAKLVLH